MNSKISYLFECTFLSSNVERDVYVVTDSFGLASSLAHSAVSSWEDSNSFELVRVVKSKTVVVADLM